MSAAVVSLFPDAQDNVVFNDTTRFSYADVERFVTEAEKLRSSTSSALYCTMLASVYRDPLGNYIEHFPVEHPWLIDEHQEMVAKRLVRFFYRPSTAKPDEAIKMIQIEGVIKSFRFEFPNRRTELMELFESDI